MYLIIGCGDTMYPGWLQTDRDQLDITKRKDWERFVIEHERPAIILSEHVMEHLQLSDLRTALALAYEFLLPHGRMRVAVPDALHPDPQYVANMSPPGCGHVSIFDYVELSALLLDAGFAVHLLEWWNERRQFKTVPWEDRFGHINRSLLNDPRNSDGKPNFTSLIIDCFKP